MSPLAFLAGESRISLTPERRRKILRDVRSRSAITKCGRLAALIALAVALAPSSAAAVKLAIKPEAARRAAAAQSAAVDAPVILDAGFEPPARDGTRFV